MTTTAAFDYDPTTANDTMTTTTNMTVTPSSTRTMSSDASDDAHVQFYLVPTIYFIALNNCQTPEEQGHL